MNSKKKYRYITINRDMKIIRKNLCGKNLKLYFMGNFFLGENFFSWKKS